MSIRFDAAADRLTYTGSIPVPTSGLTITAWVKIVNDRNDFSTPFRVYNSGQSTVITDSTDSDGTTGNNYFTGGGSASNGVAMGTGTWRAIAISHDTGTTGKAYVRVGTTTTVNSATVSSSTPAGICIGGRDSTDSSEWFDGEIAQVRIWSAELSQAQIEAEWASPTPVITANGYANWPLANATDLTDTIASRVLTTPNGSGQTNGADNPPQSTGVAERGTGALGLTSTSTPRKVAVEGGVASLGLTSSSTPRKVAVERGVGAAGLTSSSTPRKVAVERGTGAAGLTSTSAPRKVAVELGRGTVGLTSSATARKVAPTGGVGALGLTSTGLQSSALARAVTGLATLGLTTVATARKVAVELGRGTVGLTSTSTPQKRAVEVGVAGLGLTSSSTPRKVAVERGTATVGLTSRSTPGRRAAAAGRALLGLTSSSTRIPPAGGGWWRAAARVYGDMRAAARAAAATMRKG